MALIERKYGFENYAGEADITTTGGGADDNQFNAVTKGAGSVVKADDAWAASGTKSMRIDAASAQTAYAQWTGMALGATAFTRKYLQTPASWPAISYLFVLQDSSSTTIARFHIAPATQKITAVNTAGTTVGTLDYALAASTAYRLEAKVVSHASTGTIDLRLFSEHGTTALATLSLTGLNTAGGGVDQFAVGQFIATAANPAAMHFDDIAIGNTDWIGPSVRPFTGWGVPI